MSSKPQGLKDEGTKIQVTAAGATAGLISRFVIAPLDVVKIRLQLQTHSLSDALLWQKNPSGGPIYKGTLSTMRLIVRHEGLPALWKGNVPAELMYICYAAVQFGTYRSVSLMLRRVAGGDGPNPQGRLSAAAEPFVAGATAGGVATVFTYPLDLLRTRFAAQGRDRVYHNLRGAVAQIARDEGARGFFRGLAPTLSQIVPYMGLFFATYEALRPPLAAFVDLPFGGGDAAAGSLAAAIAKTGTFPLDLIKKRIQVQGPTRAQYVHKNIPEYSKGMLRTMRTIVGQEGIRGLYRGLVVSLVKAAPAAAVTMWTYQRSLQFYARLGEHGYERAS